MATPGGPASVIQVPAREGRALPLARGERVKIIDVKGQQVADLFAFCREDPAEFLSAEHTRVQVGRLFPKVGERFSTNRRRPIITIVEDGSPGPHDMLAAACDPTRYEGLGVKGWHASCQENLLKAMEAIGVRGIRVPQPVNLFANYPVGPDGTFWIDTPKSKPGDFILLRAEMDAYLCVSACPMDLNPGNAGNPTEIRIEVLR